LLILDRDSSSDDCTTTRIRNSAQNSSCRVLRETACRAQTKQNRKNEPHTHHSFPHFSPSPKTDFENSRLARRTYSVFALFLCAKECIRHTQKPELSWLSLPRTPPEIRFERIRNRASEPIA